MGYQDDATRIIRLFLRRASTLENQEMLLLANKWGVVSSHLEKLIKKLAEKEVKTLDQLYKLDLYKQFLKESQEQVIKFNQIALGVVTKNQEKFIQLGLSGTQETIKLVTINFNRLNIDSVKYMVGFSADGTPLSKLFTKSYPESVEKLTNTLINAQALGYNPLKTARLLSEDMNGNLTRALVIARTEQLNSLRTASIDQMKESGVCRGWIRIEQPDACDDCADENGKHYDFDEPFETHPNCRGATIPDIS